jgi:hypothetical protein
LRGAHHTRHTPSTDAPHFTTIALRHRRNLPLAEQRTPQQPFVTDGNASGAPTPHHFPAVSIKSTTVPRRYPLPFPFSTRFWWFLLVLVFDFHQISVVFNSFGGFGSFFVIFCSFFVVLVIYGNACGAPIPYHFPAVSIKSTTVPRRYSVPFPFISTRFWWLLLVLVVLVVFNNF